MAAATGVTAERTIDATGKYVVPGGIDPHVHMNLPFGGTFSSDDFETGTAAAAWGGTTTIIDFGLQTTGEIVQDKLAARHEEAAGVAAIDYGFHMILGDVTDEALKAMDELVRDEGVTSFKLFMAYPGVFYSDDAQILRAMQSASNNGATIMMHAENGIAIDVLAAQAVERGETDPVHHGIVRRSALEGEATNRAIVLADVAGNVPLYFVHLSASEALATWPPPATWAATCSPRRARSTCTSRSRTSSARRASKGRSGCARRRCARSTSTTTPTSGTGLRTNDLAIVSTDHCPFCFKDQKELGIGDFRAIPNGMAGVEHRMDLIYQGVADGQLSVERWVETCSTTPARMFGLFPRKGILAPGLRRRRRRVRPRPPRRRSPTRPPT